MKNSQVRPLYVDVDALLIYKTYLTEGLCTVDSELSRESRQNCIWLSLQKFVNATISVHKSMSVYVTPTNNKD